MNKVKEDNEKNIWPNPSQIGQPEYGYITDHFRIEVLLFFSRILLLFDCSKIASGL